MNKELFSRLQAKFGKVKTSRSADGHLEYQINCPFPHKDHRDTHFHLSIHGDRGVYRCWSCGHKGRVGELIDADGVDFAAPAPPPPMITDVASLRRIPDPFDAAKGGGLIPVDLLPNDHPAIVYLTKIRKRPFDPQELARTFGVFYCNIGRVFGRGSTNFDTTNTLVFPVYWTNQHPPYEPIVVGWQSRLLYEPSTLTDAECAAYGLQRDEDGKWIRPPKYFTSPGLDKGRVLYNFLNARNYPYVVVTEGVFDAFSVGPQAVSLFGKTPTEVQLSLLREYWDQVILLLDPDAGREMEKTFRQLSLSVDVTMVTLEGAKDAGDLSRESVWQQIAQKVSLDRSLSKAAIENLETEATN